MFYYEINVVAVSENDPKPKTYHKNLYSVDDNGALMLRVSAWVSAVVDPEYKILVVGISLVEV